MIHFGRSLIWEFLHYFSCIFYRDDDDAVNDVNDWGNFVN